MWTLTERERGGMIDTVLLTSISSSCPLEYKIALPCPLGLDVPI